MPDNNSASQSPSRSPACRAVSIIVPAYNEEDSIGRTLGALTRGDAENLEIIVVCNGCRDNTAAIARTFAPRVRVIETDIASKAAALNLGDQAASAYPRVYQDADVRMTPDTIRKLAAALEEPGVLASAPAPVNVLPESSHWSVRWYYRFWMSLPHVQDGMIAGGAYALSEEGRRRFGAFPNVIADDGFVRQQFRGDERVLVPEAYSEVVTPATWTDLIKTRTRSRLGVMQLRRLYPELFAEERSGKHYGAALFQIITHPSSYGGALVYGLASIISALRAKRQASQGAYKWERDESGRASAA